MGSTLLFALCSLTGLHHGTYQFYWHGVKKGTASFEFSATEGHLVSRSGFVPSSSIDLTLGAYGVENAKVSLAGSPPKVYAAENGTYYEGSRKIGDGPLFSPTHPELLAALLNRYNFSKGGFQELVAIDAAKGAPRKIEAEYFRTESRHLSPIGAPNRVSLWRLESPPNPEALVWTDGQNVPLEWWMPSLNYEAVLKGAEGLRPSAAFQRKVSPARFAACFEPNVSVPVRDGVKLIADVWRPDEPGRYPVILQRTCYDRSEFDNADGEFYAQRGYVYVSENTRGREGSGGEFQPETHEAHDGYDTIAWCAAQPWSNGRVGMTGASYNAYCEWMAATKRPKWLRTMISLVPMPSPPYGAPWDGGTHFVGAELGWFGLLRDKDKVRPYNADLTKAINALPLSQAARVQFGHDVPPFNRWLKPDSFSGDLRQTSYVSGLDKVDLPVLYLDGWLDTVALGTSLDYGRMIRNRRPHQKLIWGPWDHFTNQESHAGLTDWGPDGYIDLQTTSLLWFDRWLKCRQNGIDKEPSVSCFMLGSNRWQTYKSWPPKSAKAVRRYLNKAGSLAGRPANAANFRYLYDPSSYVYSNAHASGYFFQIGDDANYLVRQPGQLLFETKPLGKPLRLNGRIRGKLWAATDRRDTDWVMVLLDHRPDGVYLPFSCGFVRARYRNSFAHPKLLKPGELVSYNLDMWQTGIEIPPAHRLAVIVCSTLFPDQDRNLNTGEPIYNATKMLVAHQRVTSDRRHPSYVELPVVG